MADLTKQVQNAKTVHAPQGLRERVLERVEITPAPRPRNRWVLITNPAVIAGVIVLFVSVSAIVGLSLTGSRGYEQQVKSQSSPLESPPAMPEPKGSAESLSRHYSSSARVPDVATEPLVIKTAQLNIEVKDYDTAFQQATSIALSVRGFVSDSSSTAAGEDVTSGSMTIRIPAQNFEQILQRLGSLGTVKSRSVNGEDVTGQVVDLESRLRNLRAEEKQYLEIMQRASRIPDIVTVTNELSRVRGDIEQTEGQLKYLKSAANMSTIQMDISEHKKPKPVSSSAIRRTFDNALASLARTATGFAGLAIWLAVYSPFWALPLAVILYLRKRVPAV